MHKKIITPTDSIRDLAMPTDFEQYDQIENEKYIVKRGLNKEYQTLLVMEKNSDKVIYIYKTPVWDEAIETDYRLNNTKLTFIKSYECEAYSTACTFVVNLLTGQENTYHTSLAGKKAWADFQSLE